MYYLILFSSFLLYIYFIENNMKIHLARSKINDAYICLADNVNTISGSTELIEGSERANILLPIGTKFIIKDALFFTKSQRNLLNFKDIRLNGYHIETMNERDTKYLYITYIISSKKCVLEKLLVLSSRLYYTNIVMFETYATVNQKFTNTFNVWHDRLGHSGSIMM